MMPVLAYADGDLPRYQYSLAGRPSKGRVGCTAAKSENAGSACTRRHHRYIEICDYETRRELLRKNATAQLRRLDALIATNTYVPLDTQTMRRAAQLWANLRNQGRLMASEKNLDGDVILAAQVQPLTDHLVVTKNLKHLGQMCTAIEWHAL
jgi:predicted nucleic acid-binding protein